MPSYRVKMYDGSMGYGAVCTMRRNLTKAVANSIVRHYCKALIAAKRAYGCCIDIEYYVEVED